ncbi:MAG TPA: PRC-barrel domain-containing protein [Stellaceae bacterium]
MRTSSTQIAVLALAAAAFALPAAAQPASPAGTASPPSAMSPSNPAPKPSAETDMKATAPSAEMDQKEMKASPPSASADMKDDTHVATAPDMGAAPGDMAGHRASKIIGTAVVNDKDESIGKVEDIMLGQNNKATMAVISVGGFLGIGAKLVAVPFDQLQWAPNDKKSLTMPNASKAELQSMPAFKYGHDA